MSGSTPSANYVSALNYADDGPLYQRYWTGSNDRLHVVGKGITRFHAVYWPALLLSAGLPLPTTLLVHGYVTVDGRKIGKSLGNAVDPAPLAERYGSDALRYFLLRYIPSGKDGDFSAARLRAVYRAELADQLGNLVRRVLTLVERHFNSVVPAPSGALTDQDRALTAAANAIPKQISAALARFQVHDALAAIWRLIANANRYVNDTAPWQLARSVQASDRARLSVIVYVLVAALYCIAASLSPFLPRTRCCD